MASGRDNLVLQGRLYGMRGAELHRRVQDLLDRFDLGDAAGRPVRTYSGGMQRRLDVALGLVHRPQVLFLDEPTTGLDPEARATMWAEIARLAADDSLAILLTTHYLDEADRLAGQLAIVDNGRVVAEGSPEALKAELRGDAVHLELREAPDEQWVRSVVEALPGVREIVLDGRRLSARADDGAAAVPVALAALDQAGLPVATVTVARPSLDDVYLRHAGRRFAQSDAPAAVVAGGVR
jgi:ABC-2 type transport system ATP-binding protein